MAQAAANAPARARGLGRALAALLAGLLLALGVGIALASAGAPGTSACACGLGAGPTMLANGTPAAHYPTPASASKTTLASLPASLFAPAFPTGQPITFSEDLSRAAGAPQASSLKWHWSFGDGSSLSTAITPSHAFSKAGTYIVSSQTYDSATHAWAAFDSAQIEIVAALPSSPPIAKATASAASIQLGGSVTFSATGSRAQVGSTLTYLWNFDDGQTATQPRVAHQFNTPGRGFVTLTVTDARGARSVATLKLVVYQATLYASAPRATPGGAITFDAARDAPAAATAAAAGATYVWSFDDGTPTQITRQASTTHLFPTAGTYLVTVQEIAAPGQVAAEAVTVTIGAAPPRATTRPAWQIPLAVVVVIAGILLTTLSALRRDRRDAERESRRKAQRRRVRAARQRARAFAGDEEDDAWDDAAPRQRGGASAEWERGAGHRSSGRWQREDDDDGEDWQAPRRSAPATRGRRGERRRAR